MVIRFGHFNGGFIRKVANRVSVIFIISGGKELSKGRFQCAV